MKFLHLGDLHIGKSLGEFDLIEDQGYLLKQVLKTAEERKVDAILIAGDVYDKSIPSEAAVTLFDEFIAALSERGLKTFLISGNHDSEERLNFGSRLFEKNELYIASGYQGKLFKKTVRDEKGELDIYLLPYIKASQVKYYFPEEKIDSYEKAIRAVLKHGQIDFSRRCVLVAHQFVAGKGEDPKLGGSENLSVQSVGLIEKIGYDCFEGFDYVALGHIHSPQRVGRDEIRYSGSLMKYSLSEVQNDKSMPLVEITEKGDTRIELVKLKPLRDLRHLKGKLEKILDKHNVSDTEDFIYVTLTDEEIIPDAMGIIQQTYPNTVKIDYENSYTRGEVDISEFSENSEERTFEELFGDFYRMIYGCDMSEEERKLMKSVAGEVGISVETD